MSNFEKTHRLLNKLTGAAYLTITNVQQQQGGVDCGLFALANTIELCDYEWPEYIKYDQSQMRKHFDSCLKSRHFTPFPKLK